MFLDTDPSPVKAADADFSIIVYEDVGLDEQAQGSGLYLLGLLDISSTANVCARGRDTWLRWGHMTRSYCPRWSDGYTGWSTGDMLRWRGLSGSIVTLAPTIWPTSICIQSPAVSTMNGSPVLGKACRRPEALSTAATTGIDTGIAGWRRGGGWSLLLLRLYRLLFLRCGLVLGKACRRSKAPRTAAITCINTGDGGWRRFLLLRSYRFLLRWHGLGSVCFCLGSRLCVTRIRCEVQFLRWCCCLMPIAGIVLDSSKLRARDDWLASQKVVVIMALGYEFLLAVLALKSAVAGVGRRVRLLRGILVTAYGLAIFGLA